MALKAVIFDLDGTVADTLPLTIKSLKEASFAASGVERTGQEILDEFGPIDTDIARKLAGKGREYEAEELYVKVFSRDFDNSVKPVPGMNELLLELKKRGIRIGLFTGRSKRVTEIVIKRLGIGMFFDAIVAGDDTARPKPDPEGILLALEKLGVNPPESMYAGDFDVDIKAGKAAGTISALIAWASDEFRASGCEKPDVRFDKPQEFIDWLDRIDS